MERTSKKLGNLHGLGGVSLPAPERRIFCNRTLNLRSIKAIGYDMDYTLIHYHVEAWEREAYETTRKKLLEFQWPVEDLKFDPEIVVRGLIIDSELGNILKANRFGYVKQATHGTRPLDFDKQREIYSRLPISLENPRFFFLNTLFSLSEGCLFAQLVDLLDDGILPQPLGYSDLFKKVRSAIDEAHVEGAMKARIMAEPERFVERDAETTSALMDQKHAGKLLLLITNSEWSYTSSMMKWCFDPFLPSGMTWKELFDIVIVGARKPDFFFQKSPLFEVVDEEGLLRPASRKLRPNGIYLGGFAGHVEKGLGISGDEILYVGDHIYGDVHVSKRTLSWRTALVLRELEQEVRAVAGFAEKQAELESLMRDKELLEFEHSHLKVLLQRHKSGYGVDEGKKAPRSIHQRLAEIRDELEALDSRVAPLARQASELSNSGWGLLLRTGNDKSHLARQLERYADIYTSRVANFLAHTPYVYLRSPRGSLPHDPVLIPVPMSLPDKALPKE